MSYLEIKAFKSFVDGKISICPMTVLVGLNSTGKSSTIQALRMLLSANSREKFFIDELGGYEEIFSKNSARGRDIEFRVDVFSDDLYLNINENNIDSSTVENYFEYISADRLGPCATLPLLSKDPGVIGVGEKGEFSIDYYLCFENVIIPEELHHPDSKGNLLRHQLPCWMGEISPGIQLEFSRISKHDISHLEVDGHRATNAGFGISYTLPIVLAALVLSSMPPKGGFDSEIIEARYRKLKSDNRMLIIENPEAHLHPRGQTEMGKLLSIVSSLGVYCVVETHSDHLVDGIRISVRNNGLINEENVIFNFFSKDKSGVTIVDEISIKNNGKLERWPDGFFDQSIKNLRELSI